MTTLDQALRVAAIMRQLREADVADARECWDLLQAARAAQLPAGDCDRYVERLRSHVAAARKWNRQLLIASRAIRRGLYRRQVGRPSFVPAAARLSAVLSIAGEAKR